MKKIKPPSKRKIIEYQKNDDLLREIAILLKCDQSEIRDRVKKLLEKIEQTKEELASVNKKLEKLSR